MIVVAQVLLVQSALSIMSQQHRTSTFEDQHASAEGTQPSSSPKAAQLRAEYDAHLVAAAERAQEVGGHCLVHCTQYHRQGIAAAKCMCKTAMNSKI